MDAVVLISAAHRGYEGGTAGLIKDFSAESCETLNTPTNVWSGVNLLAWVFNVSARLPGWMLCQGRHVDSWLYWIVSGRPRGNKASLLAWH